jgi:hypothetical protein
VGPEYQVWSSGWLATRIRTMRRMIETTTTLWAVSEG